MWLPRYTVNAGSIAVYRGSHTAAPGRVMHHPPRMRSARLAVALRTEKEQDEHEKQIGATSFLVTPVIRLGYRDSNPNYLIQSQASYR